MIHDLRLSSETHNRRWWVYYEMRAVLGLALTAVLSATLAIPATAQHDAHKRPALGTIVFPNSGKPGAQEPFLRGLALLHSFEYPPAANAFREAQRADPGFALAYWSEALTYSHVLWRTEDLPSSRAALARLAPTARERLTKARTPRERSFGAAVEAFYEAGPVPKRVRAYANAMHRRALAAPDDQEAAAFASHALMIAGRQTDGAARDSLFREAIRLAQKVAAANPNHPGATHYLIHLYDTPGMAAQGLTFARTYDRIAPDADHALHMPSHIYLQLGLWDDVARSNERAWGSSRGSTEDPALLRWHPFSWLHYAYLQQGRWRAARSLIDTARALLVGVPAGYSDAPFVITQLEFQQAAETGLWQRPLTRPTISAAPPASDREREFRQIAAYWLAVDAAQRGDTTLTSLAAPFLAIADSVRSNQGTRSPMMASNALVVRALVARARRDTAGATEWLRTAMGIERRLSAFVGPPERVFPAELFALEVMAGAKGPQDFAATARGTALREAVAGLENVLRLCPNRSRTLFMLGTAKNFLGDSTGAASAFEKLGASWPLADEELLRLLPSRR
jgi:tetratricopeptide (TPR) repeat protein